MVTTSKDDDNSATTTANSSSSEMGEGAMTPTGDPQLSGPSLAHHGHTASCSSTLLPSSGSSSLSASSPPPRDERVGSSPSGPRRAGAYTWDSRVQEGEGPEFGRSYGGRGNGGLRGRQARRVAYDGGDDVDDDAMETPDSKMDAAEVRLAFLGLGRVGWGFPGSGQGEGVGGGPSWSPGREPYGVRGLRRRVLLFTPFPVCFLGKCSILMLPVRFLRIVFGYSLVRALRAICLCSTLRPSAWRRTLRYPIVMEDVRVYPIFSCVLLSCLV